MQVQYGVVSRVGRRTRMRAEVALPGYETMGWFGILSPAKMPAAIINRMNSEMNRALDRTDVKAVFTGQSLESIGGTRE